MKFLGKLFLLNVLIGVMASSLALTQDEEPVLAIFQRGVQQFNEKKFEEAKESFLLAYQREPQNSTFSYNLALSFAETKKGPQALGYLRRTLELNPFSLEFRSAWNYYLKKFPPPEIPRRLSSWDLFIDSLRPLPSLLIFFPLMGALIFFGFLVTRRIRETKSDAEHQSSSVSLWASVILLAFLSFFYAAKIYDLSLCRGTLLAENVSVKAAPEDGASEITQFPAGAELIIQEKQGDWLKVQYPGSFTGWVKQEAILITSLTSPKQTH